MKDEKIQKKTENENFSRDAENRVRKSLNKKNDGNSKNSKIVRDKKNSKTKKENKEEVEVKEKFSFKKESLKIIPLGGLQEIGKNRE